MCVLSDHQPANHQEFELSVTEETTVNTGKSKEHCAQDIISEFKDARTQRISPDSNTVKFERQNEHCAQPIISEFEDARTQRFIPDSDTVMFERQNEHCAQSTISEFDGARTQKFNSELNTVVIKAEIHAENTDAQHMVFVCWSLTSLCHSNGHIETMPAREINPFTALTRIRSQLLRTH